MISSHFRHELGRCSDLPYPEPGGAARLTSPGCAARRLFRANERPATSLRPRCGRAGTTPYHCHLTFNPSVKQALIYPRGRYHDRSYTQFIDGRGSTGPAASRPNLDKGFNPLTMIMFFGILAAGLLFVAYSIYADVDATGVKVTTICPSILCSSTPDRARLRIRHGFHAHRHVSQP